MSYRFSCLLSLLAACSMDVRPQLMASTEQAVPRTAAAGAAAPRTGEPTPIGAGMPVIPIHRDDAGISSAPADAGVMPPPTVMDAQMADDAGDSVPPPPTPPVITQPLHRYDFSGSGSTVRDMVGQQHGRLVGGAVLDGQGGAELDGRDGYIELPPGLLTVRSDLTWLLWLRWDGGECWQRILDLSDVDSEQRRGLFLTPSKCPEQVPAYGRLSPRGEDYVIAQRALRMGVESQVGIVFMARTGRLQFIVDGSVVSERQVRLDGDVLAELITWLGRSRFPRDPYFRGRFSELRVYDQALGRAEIEALYERGPDVP